MEMRPFAETHPSGGPGAARARPVPATDTGMLPANLSAGLYGYAGYTKSGPRWSVLALILCLHGAALAVLISTRYEVERQPVERLQTFSLNAPAEPTPPQPEETVTEAAPAPTARITAPQSRLVLPREMPLPAVAPKLVDQNLAPVRTALAIPARISAPTPRPAPPAPVTAPDFRAGQLANPGPSYPYLSRKAREEGVVTLRVLVSAQGKAKQLDVEQSSGFDRLDDEALKTVRKWNFLPARRGGEAIEAWVLVPVTFALG